MDREQIMKLDGEGLRVEIAKVKAYRFWDRRGSLMVTKPDDHEIPPGWIPVDDVSGLPVTARTFAEVPNWPGDLAEAYKLEGEVILRYYIRDHYLWELARITLDLCPSDLQIREMRGFYEDQLFALVHATAEQRARAWYLSRAEGG